MRIISTKLKPIISLKRRRIMVAWLNYFLEKKWSLRIKIKILY